MRATGIGAVIQYWLGHITYPIDSADRVLLMVGAVAAFVRRSGGPEMISPNLMWQIPLGAVIIFIVGRVLSAPLRVLNDIQATKAGPKPTVDSLNMEVEELKATLQEMKRQLETFTDMGAESPIPDWHRRWHNRDNRTLEVGVQ